MSVQCAKLPYRGKVITVGNHVEVINVCSTSRQTGTWQGQAFSFQDLSPFYLGPVTISVQLPTERKVTIPEGKEQTSTAQQTVSVTFQRFENCWQGLKLYQGDLHEDGFPTQTWYDRVFLAAKQPHGLRHIGPRNCVTNSALIQPLAKPKRPKPIGHWFGGQVIGYLQARKQIYIPYYQALVKPTHAYQFLKHHFEVDRAHICITGFDGRPYKNLLQELNNVTRPFGHELVLCAMLTGKSLL